MKVRNIPPSNIRFPDELKKQIDESAEKNRRSMNSEVIFAVESHYANSEKYKNLSNFSINDLIDELKRRLGEDAVDVHIDIGKPKEQ
jgi:hypothetical protein